MLPTASQSKLVSSSCAHNKLNVDCGQRQIMRKKPRKRSSRGRHPIVSVFTPMAYSLVLVISSVFIVSVGSENTVIEGQLGVNDVYNSDSSIQPNTKPPLRPLINKCCPFDQHYQLAPDGQSGQCVSSIHIGDDVRIIGMKTARNDDNGHTLWHVPTILPESTATTMDSGSVPDYEDTQSTTQVPIPIVEDELEPTPDADGGNRTSRGLNDTILNGSTILTNGGPNPVTFRLKVGKPKCSELNMIRKIIHHTKLAHREEEESESSSNFTVLTFDGSLQWVDEEGMMNTRQNQDFCIDQLDETNYIALICKPLCNDLSPCIRKCCPPDKILDLANERCVKAVNPWRPYLYTLSLEQVNSDDHLKLHSSHDYHYTYGIPGCDSYLISLREDPLDKMYPLVNGTLMTINRGHRLMHHPETYCIDGTINHEPGGEELIFGPEHEPVHYSGSELDQVAIACIPKVPQKGAGAPKPLPWRFTLFAGAEFTTSFFLFLTAMVYIILWDQQNIHGWLQFAYVVSLLQSYMCLGILQLKSEDINTLSPKLCEAMGSVIHFSFLSAFFWMTSMNFDLWWTFRYDIVGCSTMRPRSKGGEIRRFCIFALFSWGSSGIISGTGLALDHKYRHDPDSPIIRPHFGENFCYFDNNESQLYYFYAPMGVLLLINLVFFFSTIFSLHRLQKVTKIATEHSSKSEKRTFLLFIKLFVVMGVLWVFEVISWAAQANASHETEEFWIKLFLATDILNSSQGVLIFIIFTCKKNTCRQIEGQLKKFTLFLQQNRDKGYGSTIWSHTKGAFVVIFASCTLPIIHLLRIVLNYFGRLCGRKVLAGDTSGKTISSNATTITAGSMFDKSRKVSDCSMTTTISSVVHQPGGGEPHYATSSSNASSITNIEMDLTSIVSLKT